MWYVEAAAVQNSQDITALSAHINCAVSHAGSPSVKMDIPRDVPSKTESVSGGKADTAEVLATTPSRNPAAQSKAFVLLR